ncbi:hypothetical protein IL992_37480 [Microbispora sp. NEAU-D428]|uniref:hypothetical protein n=1 Tax=Microbispora sitophila TaxID=2771537 RepID=UPI0018679FD0|nr:hypothetical protein [Microbispora sitophila]MBE3014826.1 hypothetical protein [Microbispora sitophila]
MARRPPPRGPGARPGPDSSTDRGYRTEWSAYVTGRGSAAALDEARAVAVAAVGVYMLDLADLIQQARGDDATTMRAMAGRPSTGTRRAATAATPSGAARRSSSG